MRARVFSCVCANRMAPGPLRFLILPRLYFPAWAGFLWMSSSLLSTRAGLPLKAAVPATSLRHPLVALSPAGPASRPCAAAAAPGQQSRTGRPCSPQTRRNTPRPLRLWPGRRLRLPPALSRPRPRPRQSWGSLSSSPRCPAARSTLIPRRKRPARRRCDQKVELFEKGRSLRLPLASLLTFDALIAAAVTGYQQPSEASSARASQFFISLLDSNNKEQRLDERGLALRFQ